MGRHEEAVISYDKALEGSSKLRRDFHCGIAKIEIIEKNNQLLPYLMNRWARGRRNLWNNLRLIFFKFQFIILFCGTLLLVFLLRESLLGQILRWVVSALFTTLALLIIPFTLMSLKKNIGLTYSTYFKSGFLSYVRAFLIVIVTSLAGAAIYTYSPSFLQFGWGQIIFSNSGNWGITRPFEVADKAAETANSFQQNLSSKTQEAPHLSTSEQSSSSARPSKFNYRWIFIPTVWMLLVSAFPSWAKWEEEKYRQGVHTWKGITISSIKFGLSHLIMGIPICWGLSLSIPGFLFACRYKHAYQKHLKRFGDEEKAQEVGVAASTADHAIYNAILITILTVVFLFQ